MADGDNRRKVQCCTVCGALCAVNSTTLFMVYCVQYTAQHCVQCTAQHYTVLTRTVYDVLCAVHCTALCVVHCVQ